MGRYVPPDHACSFPDEACSFCEGTLDPGPPCCHTPYLCGGPFEDCHDSLKAEALTNPDGSTANPPGRLDWGCPLCDEADDPYCAYHTPQADFLTPTIAEFHRNIRNRGAGERNDVVHVRHCCPGCATHGSNGICW